MNNISFEKTNISDTKVTKINEVTLNTIQDFSNSTNNTSNKEHSQNEELDFNEFLVEPTEEKLYITEAEEDFYSEEYESEIDSLYNWDELENYQEDTLNNKIMNTISLTSVPITDLVMEKNNISDNYLKKLDILVSEQNNEEIIKYLNEIGKTSKSLEDIQRKIPIENQIQTGYIILDNSLIRNIELLAQKNNITLEDFELNDNILSLGQFESLIYSIENGNIISSYTNKNVDLLTYIDIIGCLPYEQAIENYIKLLSAVFISKNNIVTNLSPIGNVRKNALINMVNEISDENIKKNLLIDLLSNKLYPDREFEYYTYYLGEKVNREYDNGYTRLYDSIIESYSNGNKTIAYRNMMCLASMVNYMNFELIDGEAYYGGDLIVLDKNVNSKGTTLHEFGHAIHENACNNYVPKNIDKLLLDAQNNGKKNLDKLQIFQESNCFNNGNVWFDSQCEFENIINEKYGSIENYQEKIRNEIIDELSDTDVYSLLWKYDINIDVFDPYFMFSLQSELDEETIINLLPEIIYNERKSNYVETSERVGPGPAVSDIIAAIYKTDSLQINDTWIPLTFAHDDEYWNQDGSNYSYYELMANYNDLLMTGRTDMIEELRSIFGDELFDSLDNTYNMIYN